MSCGCGMSVPGVPGTSIVAPISVEADSSDNEESMSSDEEEPLPIPAPSRHPLRQLLPRPITVDPIRGQ